MKSEAKYFNGVQELKNPFGMRNEEFSIKFPGVKGLKQDSFFKICAYPKTGFGGPLPVERIIFYSNRPSLHECNAKCLNGKHNGSCECKCKGANHGRGSLIPSF